MRGYLCYHIIVRGNNVFGPCQYPEKIIPTFVTRLLLGKKVPLHGDGSNIRTYIFADDFSNALDVVLITAKKWLSARATKSENGG